LIAGWLAQDPAQDDPNSTWAHCHNQELRGLMNITTPHAAGLKGNASSSGPYVFVSMPMFCGADDRLAADTGLVCDEEGTRPSLMWNPSQVTHHFVVKTQAAALDADSCQLRAEHSSLFCADLAKAAGTVWCCSGKR